MAEDHLSHDRFFAELTNLFQTTQSKEHGSVYLTQKRLSHGQQTSTTPNQTLNPSLPQNPQFPDQAPDITLPIVVRATNGNPKTKKGERWVVSKQSKRVKISTIVKPEDMDAFFSKYSDVCKAGMGSLKKRDRSKRKKKEKKKKTDG